MGVSRYWLRCCIGVLVCVLALSANAGEAQTPAAKIIVLARHGHYELDPKADPKLGPGLSTLGIAQATDRDAALTAAQQDEPLRHQRFAERIRVLGERLLGLRPEVATTARAVQIQLQDIAVAELERQQERLAVYAAQARLAIAQIHDRAQFARRSDVGAAEGSR